MSTLTSLLLLSLAAVSCAVNTEIARAQHESKKSSIMEHDSAGASAPGRVILNIGGKTITQVGADPTPVSATFQKSVNTFIASALAPIGSKNMRSAEAANSALKLPAPATQKLGNLAVFYPGAGSWGPSASFVFRLAAHAKYVVICYEYAQVTGMTMVAPKVFDGVPVPASLQGRIFTIGDGSNRAFRDPDQGADQIISFYALMAQNQATLLGGLDVMNSKSTLMGHSEGSFCVVLARDRLNKAGFPSAIGNLVTLGGGIGSLDKAVQQTGTGLVFEFNFITAVNNLFGASKNPDITSYLAFVKKVDTKQWPNSQYLPLVDLGVGSAVGSSNTPSDYVRAQFVGAKLAQQVTNFISSPASTLFSFVKNAVTGKNKNLGDFMDGIMPTALTLAGKKTYCLQKPHDHGYQIEDFATIDEWAPLL